jgi:ribokinase
VNTRHCRTDTEHATGVALIAIDAAGRNFIVVAPGANGVVSRADVDAASDLIAESDCLLVQLEIPADTVAYAMLVARRNGTLVALNPAPVSGPLPSDWIGLVDLLTPNEHEAATLLGVPYAEDLPWPEIAAKLQKLTGARVVVTLGEAGCLAADEGGVERIAADPVVAVDTTAAGDCFTGGLVVALTEGKSLAAACRFAGRAAAISTTRLGAQASVPSRNEVGESFE